MTSLTHIYKNWLSRPTQLGYCCVCRINRAVCCEADITPLREYCSDVCVGRAMTARRIGRALERLRVPLSTKRVLHVSPDELDQIQQLPLELQIALLELVFAERATDTLQFAQMWQLRTTSQHYRTLIDQALLSTTRGLPDEIGRIIRPDEFALFTGLHELVVSPQTPYITVSVLETMRFDVLHTLTLHNCDLSNAVHWNVPRLVHLGVVSCACDLDFYTHFPGLNTLRVAHSGIDVALLKTQTALTDLDLTTMRYNSYIQRVLNPEALTHLTWLTRLQIDGFSISLDQALSRATFTSLTRLDLLNLDEPVQRLYARCTNLQYLRIYNVPRLDCRDLGELHSLQEIYISGVKRGEDAHIESLGRLPSLARLDMRDYTTFPGDALPQLTQLSELILPHGVWEPVLDAHLAPMTQLRVLRLGLQETTPNDALSQLTNLTELYIDAGEQLVDATLQPLVLLNTLAVTHNKHVTAEAFHTLTNLTDLNIEEAQGVDRDALRLPPRCRVRYTEFFVYYDVVCTEEGLLPPHEMLVL